MAEQGERTTLHGGLAADFTGDYVDVEELMSRYKCPRCGYETDEWPDLFCDGCETGIISSFDAKWAEDAPDYNEHRTRVVR